MTRYRNYWSPIKIKDIFGEEFLNFADQGGKVSNFRTNIYPWFFQYLNLEANTLLKNKSYQFSFYFTGNLGMMSTNIISNCSGRWKISKTKVGRQRLDKAQISGRPGPRKVLKMLDFQAWEGLKVLKLLDPGKFWGGHGPTGPPSYPDAVMYSQIQECSKKYVPIWGRVIKKWDVYI